MGRLRFLSRTRTVRMCAMGLMLLTILLAASALPFRAYAYRAAGPVSPAMPGTTSGITDYTFKWLFMPTGVPQVIIRDCPADIGAEPNASCGALWASSAIYVRNSPGAFPAVHQSPIPGQPNYVYAKVENIGSAMLRRGKVHFYVAKASTGLLWDTHWDNNYIGGVLYGDEIGSVDVINLAAGGSVNVGVLWNNVPDPYNYSDPDARHFCLLARFVSDEDPMTFPEGVSVVANTGNNNNIAWKNVSIMDCANPRAAIDVLNGTRTPMNAELAFDIPDDEEQDPVMNHCTLRVDMGPELYAMWVQNERQGEGIYDLGEGKILVHAKHAWVGGLILSPEKRYTMHVEIVFREDDESTKVYHWNITQRTNKGEVIGGETYDIRTRCRADVMIRDCNADAGAEPSLACGPVFWSSPAIYIRNNPGALPAVHQNPIGGSTNWAYVQVKNIGERILHHGTVRLYYSKASLGLVWASSWAPDLEPYKKQIGTATVINLGPNQSTTVEIRWDNVPNPAAFTDPDARHFCLLARFESTEDPMTYPEGPSLAYNVPHNNNIAQKNVSIMDCDYPRAAVDVYNGTNNEAATQLHFDVPEEDGTDNALNHVNITVDLGEDIATRWRTGEMQGEGIEAVGNTGIRITGPHAWIGGFELEPDERLTMHVEIEHQQGQEPENPRDAYDWTITQYAKGAYGNPVLVGGETYDIRRKCRPDIMIKDYIGDVGAEPNLVLGGHYWSSPDIYVRNIPDGLGIGNDVHQNPIGGTTNWVYVKLKNIGNATLTGGTLSVYYSKASLGLSWDASWILGYPYGDFINAVPVGPILPGAEVRIPVEWTDTPDPADFSDADARHFCLLARFESTQDPISHVEGTALGLNVPYNNNIAMKNTTIMDCDYPRAAIDVYNGNDHAVETEVRFDTPWEDGDDNVLNHVNIAVNLGPKLMRKWMRGGMKGTGVEASSEQGILNITSPHAWIGGLKLEPDERQTMHVELKYFNADETQGARDAYEWNITQYEKGRIGPVGGEHYTIRRKCRPDVMIRDYVGDVGAEPNLSYGGHFWSSPDIYIRNLPDGIPVGNRVHQNPIGGTTNWVYVRLKNIGNATLGAGTVEVHFAKASTGLSWTSSWTTYPYGGPVGTGSVGPLAPGAETIVEIPWTTTPDPAMFTDPDARHFCLLARFVSTQDPMSFTEGTSIAYNVPYNNNIAQKNLSIMDCNYPRAAIDIYNGTEDVAVTTLQFDTPHEDGDDNALNHVNIAVDLGTELMGIWQQGGKKGAGVEYEGNGTVVNITGPHAWIGGINLPPDKRYTMHVELEYLEENPEQNVRDAYDWGITQHTMGEGGTVLVGGETYTIRRKCRPDVMIRDYVGDVGAEPNLSYGGHFWSSPDIYIRNSNDGQVIGNDVHQNPIGGTANWIYVKLKNIGSAPLTSGMLHVYFSKASTGLFWDVNWTSGYPFSEEIDVVPVPVLAPGAETIVEIPWLNTPDPSWFSDPDARHFCLLARLESTQDPMSFTEGTSIAYNVPYNNNIAQKNTTLMDCEHNRGTVGVFNGRDEATVTQVRFNVPWEDGEDHALKHFGIKVELDEATVALWEDGGKQGAGIGRVKNDPNTFVIRSPHAWIGGIELAAGAGFNMTVEIENRDQKASSEQSGKRLDGELGDVANPGAIALPYRWVITQYEQGNPAPVGGEDYELYIKRCRPNILIRDCLSDVGVEPCTTCPVNWESPDIYVRRQPDGLSNDTHEDPVAGYDNHVYVKLKNIGNGTLASGTVYVYYSKAGTGFDWSSDWLGAAPLGDMIGYADVSGLVSGGATTVEIPWTSLPTTLSWDKHFCLLARFESTEDPMTYPEVTASGLNVYNNNNIAQKNIDVLDSYNRIAPLFVRSDNPAGAAVELHFDVPEDEGNGILSHGPVTVVLGEDLYEQWENGDFQGEGIEPLEGLQAVSVTSPHAWIGGLQLTHKGTSVYVIMPDQDRSTNVYHWRVSQYENGDERPTGGETYEINSSPGLTVIGCKDRTAFYLGLIMHPTTRELRFTIPTAEGNGILAHGPITVDLGPDLYQKWEDGGYQGDGISDAGNNSTILITDPDAWIGGLEFQELGFFVLTIRMPECDGSGLVYHWSITQHEQGGSAPIAQMNYEIRMGDGLTKPALPEKGDLSRMLELTARPNPFNAATSIGFTLPINARVTLAIYDANGRMVRSLLANTEQTTGRHEVLWDGNATDGTAVPNGTYFYRLVTPMGTTEQQLKLVR